VLFSNTNASLTRSLAMFGLFHFYTNTHLFEEVDKALKLKHKFNVLNKELALKLLWLISK